MTPSRSTSVDTNDVRETTSTNGVLNNLVDICLSHSLEAYSNRDMKLELVNSITTIFDDIVLKSAGMLLVEFVFVSNRTIRRVNNAVLGFDTGLTIEYFRPLSIQHIDDICKIALIEEHTPI